MGAYMIFKFFRMKAAEVEVKLAVYTYLLAAIRSKDELIELFGNLTAELSSTPARELKDKFIAAMAELAQAKNGAGTGNK